MQFGYTILYVDDVVETIGFYERAFGLKRKMLHEREYGELDTGGTKLAFAARDFVKGMIPLDFDRPGGAKAAPFEIGLVTEDVQSAFETAVKAGATPVKEPAKKPWGQTVGYVSDNNGFLVELCTPIY